MAYPHTAACIIVLHDNPINPVQEPPIVVGEVPDNNTNNPVVGKIPDDNGLVFPDSVLEFSGVELVERFPGFTPSGVRIRCHLSVLFPDFPCCSCFIDIMPRRGVFCLQCSNLDRGDICQLAAPGFGKESNREAKVAAPVPVCLLCLLPLVKGNTYSEGNFIIILPT